MKNVFRGLEKVVDRLETFELPDVESSREHPSSFFAGPHGEARIIRGEIIGLASTTMTVKVWGLSLAVDMGSARFHPDGASASTLKIGDKVNVKGKINSSNGVITASLVHALSSRQRFVDELFDRIVKLIERLRELQAKAGLPLTPLPAPSTATSTP